MLRALSTSATALTLLVAAAPLADRDPGGPGPDDAVRIGTYDNRAIAVAYAASEFNPVGARMAEYEAAREAGDSERTAELEAWGEALQRQLHRQGFARVPVDDLLAHVADGVPALAERRDLDAIVFACDWSGEAVERVDVTLDLVALYQPSERTMERVRGILAVDPVDLDELRDH